MAPQPSEADIIFNRANVALAKSQRLVASWLPPRTDEEVKNSKTEAQIEEEEQELFTPVPEVLGLGAKIPEDFKDKDLKRGTMSSEDLLRRQLLGRGQAKLQSTGGKEQGSQRGFGGTLPMGSKPRPTPAKRRVEDDSSSDEGGRSSLGRKKQKNLTQIVNSGMYEGIDKESQHEEPRVERPVSAEHGAQKKVKNYLDEVLFRKREKKFKVKKKKKKKGREGQASS